jgi:hypothetical protein
MPPPLQHLIDRALSSNEVLAVLVAALLSAFGWIFLRVYTGRPRVAWAFSHQHAFYLKNANPPFLAYTKEMWIQNAGRVVAEEVEIILPTRPAHFDIWPQLRFTETNNPDGSLSIKFDHLNPREHVTLSIFQTVNEPLSIANVRWHGGVAKKVPMGPQQILPRWWARTLVGFILFGFFSLFYFAVRLLWL